MIEYGKKCELFSEKFILGRMVLFLAVLFMSVDGWSGCVENTAISVTSLGGCGYCNNNNSEWGCVQKDVGDKVVNNNGTYCVITGGDLCSTCQITSGYCYQRRAVATCCSDPCEQDSTACVMQGDSWVDDPNSHCGKSCSSCDEECQCEQQGKIWTGTECIEDTSICSGYKAQCVGLGGKFTGRVINMTDGSCCSAICDLCGNQASKNVFEIRRQQCCAENKAPPSMESRCDEPLQSGCGMTSSEFTDPNSNDFQCQDPNNSSETMDRFAEMCSENYSSDSQGGSSDSQDNSSDSQSSSSGDCEGADCGSSDSQGGSSDSYSSGSIDGSSDSHGTSSGDDGDDGCEECKWLDSILDTLHRVHATVADIKLCMQVPGLCVGMQQDIPVFQFDTAYIKYLKPYLDSSLHLDSNQVKLLMKLDSNMIKQLRNDSAQLENDTMTWGKFHMVGDIIDTSLHSMNDTTRKWLKNIADLLGVSTDSLIAHIDSVVYGFSLVDSLTDSVVKYFNLSFYYDSVYRVKYLDSLNALHEELIDIPSRTASAVNYALGYGDTSTVTLRSDLLGIKDAIEGLGDGIGGNIAGSLDSAIRSGGGADTSGVSYGWLEHGESLGDSIKNGSGFGGLDFAADSVMRDSLASLGYSCDNDSCCVGSECIYFDSDAMIEDSLTRYVNRMGDSIEQRNKDYLEDSTTTLFQEVKDSLTAFNPLGIFDSTLLSTLGAKIPNSNTCPDHCSKFEVDIPFSFGTRHFTIDYGLCLGRSVFGNGNILSFLRFIIRLIIAITCISAVMWNASRIRR